MAGTNAVTKQFNWKKFGHAANVPLQGLLALGAFKRYRQEGQHFIPAMARTIWDFGIMGHPLMFSMQMASTAFSLLNTHAQGKVNTVRTRMRGFTSAIPDTEELARSRQQLMQAGIAANNQLRLSGSAWAGNEAAALHRRYSR